MRTNVTWQTPGRDLDNEEVRYKLSPSWFCDITHSWPPQTPMGAYYWNRYCCSGSNYAYEHVIHVPHMTGCDKRNLDGATYRRIFIVDNEEEIKARKEQFKRNMQPFLKDFAGWWKSATDDMDALYAPLKSFDHNKASFVELRDHLYDLQYIGRRLWEHHFVGMVSVFWGWVWFEEKCKELLGIDDKSAEFMKLVVGYDSKLFEVDKSLWMLSRKALELDLKDVFMDNAPADVVEKLKGHPHGNQWLDLLGTFLQEHGWRMQHMHDFYSPTWIEDPAPAIAAIRSFFKDEGGQWKLDSIRPKLAKKREKAVAEVMQRIPGEQKEEFQDLLRLSQHAGTFSEEHTYWCEMAGYAVIRHGFMGIGRRFVEAGTIDRPDDIFFLTPDEIDLAILVPDRFDLRYIVKPRKEARNNRTYESIHPVLTTRASAAEASALDVLPSQDAVGIKVLGFEVPPVNSALKADMYGLFGAPGVVEGTARVVNRNDDLDKLVPGEIMVSAKISSSWSPIFALLGGAVTDRGGSLGHTGCLCREYGIPAVVNTVNENREFVSAAAMIKTGQRIRVDGTNHAVYILDK